MAEQNGSNGANAAPGEVYRFVRRERTARYRIAIDGVEYPVLQIIQLTKAQEDDLRRLEDRAEGATDLVSVRRSAYDRDFYLLRALVPTLPESVLGGLDLAEAKELAGQAWRFAHQSTDPSLPDTGPGAGTNSSPVSGAVTAGARPS